MPLDATEQAELKLAFLQANVEDYTDKNVQDEDIRKMLIYYLQPRKIFDQDQSYDPRELNTYSLLKLLRLWQLVEMNNTKLTEGMRVFNALQDAAEQSARQDSLLRSLPEDQEQQTLQEEEDVLPDIESLGLEDVPNRPSPLNIDSPRTSSGNSEFEEENASLSVGGHATANQTNTEDFLDEIDREASARVQAIMNETPLDQDSNRSQLFRNRTRSRDPDTVEMLTGSGTIVLPSQGASVTFRRSGSRTYYGLESNDPRVNSLPEEEDGGRRENEISVTELSERVNNMALNSPASRHPLHRLKYERVDIP